ncbi:MAG: EutN/CcmL family microcompartment protein [Candidatus Marinimicrobia bacterium]|nr:EutN/CcmL family microcompartment protein [Candidatus Neomarinimicrobiota bacterium]
MFLAEVTGTVWATKKVDNLANLRFLVVRPGKLHKKADDEYVIVADVLGAGPGEQVICAYGHAARRAICPENPSSLSIEAAVIGIVDKLDITETSTES